MPVTVERIQASSVTSGMSDWRKKDGLLRIEAQSQVVQGHSANVLGKLPAVLDGRQRVVVRDEEEALSLVLERDVLSDRSEIVAQVQLSRGLHARQNAGTARTHRERLYL